MAAESSTASTERAQSAGDRFAIAFFKRFWVLVGSITALVAAYFGLRALHLSEVFWIVVGGSLVLALIWVGGPRVLVAVDRARKYPRLLERVADLQERLDDEVDTNFDLRGRVAEGRAEGVDEGRREILGALLSAVALEVPRLSVVLPSDGTVSLIGDVSEASGIQVGARFELVVEKTEQRLGVVEVVLVDAEKSTLHMQCVERTAPAFWRDLEQRSPADFGPPQGVVLRRLGQGEDLIALLAPSNVELENGSGS